MYSFVHNWLITIPIHSWRGGHCQGDHAIFTCVVSVARKKRRGLTRRKSQFWQDGFFLQKSLLSVCNPLSRNSQWFCPHYHLWTAFLFKFWCFGMLWNSWFCQWDKLMWLTNQILALDLRDDIYWHSATPQSPLLLLGCTLFWALRQKLPSGGAKGNSYLGLGNVKGSLLCAIISDLFCHKPPENVMATT